MKNVIFASLATLLIGSLAQAALPPTAESLRRLVAVAQSSDVHQRLGPANDVKSISNLGNGRYQVVTDDCVLDVTVELEPTDMVGPNPLKVIVGKSTCLP